VEESKNERTYKGKRDLVELDNELTYKEMKWKNEIMK